MKTFRWELKPVDKGEIGMKCWKCSQEVIVLAVSYITTFKKIDEEYANWSKAQTDAYSSDYTF